MHIVITTPHLGHTIAWAPAPWHAGGAGWSQAATCPAGSSSLQSAARWRTATFAVVTISQAGTEEGKRKGSKGLNPSRCTQERGIPSPCPLPESEGDLKRFLSYQFSSPAAALAWQSPSPAAVLEHPTALASSPGTRCQPACG